MKIVQFEKFQSDQWDAFVESCPMSTFLHTQRFLSYHGNRFQDRSLIIEDDEGKWLGIIPAALNPSDDNEIISHPGITFGGILHQRKLIGQLIIEAFEEVKKFYAEKGYKRLIYKAVPYIYHRIPASDDLYALFRSDAKLYRRDLSCAIDLDSPLSLSSKELSTMQRRFRKAEQNHIFISDSLTDLNQLWCILTKNLRDKYSTNPVHCYEEISGLATKFPQNIKIITAKHKEQVVAGLVLFISPLVYHTQYLVVTPEGAEVFALDYIINYSIELARQHKVRYFDFGTSNEQQGQYLNQGLYKSKAKHGGGGIAYDFYKIDLQ